MIMVLLYQIMSFFQDMCFGDYNEKKHRTIVRHLRELIQEVIYSGKYNAKLYDIEDRIYNIQKIVLEIRREEV